MSLEKQPQQTFAYDVLGTNYPYINVKQDSQSQLLADFRRSISSINPFALRQVPSEDRHAFGYRWGNQFFTPNPYPNNIHFDRLFPTHYDPLSESAKSNDSLQLMKSAPNTYSKLVFSSDKFPRPCIRTIQYYQRCKMVNDKTKCEQEKNDILSICPNWALDSMKEKKRQQLKKHAIDRQVYENAMKVEDYNQGKSVSQISNKTWKNGTRHYLRPDTMWPDDRYSEITQQEVNEAKQRMAERTRRQEGKAEKKQASAGPQPNNDNIGEQPVKLPKSLYP
ncbi:hypothetical protein IMG5_146230, partial [Ichthyophthirius multifiliis]